MFFLVTCRTPRLLNLMMMRRSQGALSTELFPHEAAPPPPRPHDRLSLALSSKKSAPFIKPWDSGAKVKPPPLFASHTGTYGWQAMSIPLGPRNGDTY